MYEVFFNPARKNGNKFDFHHTLLNNEDNHAFYSLLFVL